MAERDDGVGRTTPWDGESKGGQADVASGPLPRADSAAEQAVLGSVLLDNRLWAAISAEVAQEDFYFPHHALIYGAIKRLIDRGEPIDLITLATELRAASGLHAAGGPHSLAALPEVLWSRVATTAHLPAHLGIVKDAATVRALASFGRELAMRAADPSLRVEELCDLAITRVMSIARRRRGVDLVSIGKTIDEIIERYQKAAEEGRSLIGIPMGFRDLDRKTTGMHPGDMILVAARPGCGKTSFGVNVAENVTGRAGPERRGTVFISLEMPRAQLVIRLLCGKANVDQMIARTGEFSEEQWSAFVAAAGSVYQYPLWFGDASQMTLQDIAALVRRAKLLSTAAGVPLGLVVIDYAQLVRVLMERGRNREQEVGDVARGAKAVAKDEGIAVMALAQLNRNPESRGDKRPQLADLRESGSLEQEADMVLGLYRDELYNHDTKKKGVAEVIILKQRNGPLDTIELGFDKRRTLFYNLETDHADARGQPVPEPADARWMDDTNLGMPDDD